MIPIADAAAASGVERAIIEKLIDDGLVTPEKRGRENYVSLAEVRAALAEPQAPAAPPEHTRTRRRRHEDDEHDAENEKE